MYLVTDHQWWVDHVYAPSHELQRERLGGLAYWIRKTYPGHVVSWKFKAPANDESVAILVSGATTKNITVIAYNLEDVPVTAVMTGWDIEPGKWEVLEGIDNDGDDKADFISGKRTLPFERTGRLTFTFPPKKTTVLQLKLKNKGKSYWERPDLGIGEDDVKISGNKISVTVHSLGSVDAPPSTVALVDANGKQIAASPVSALKAPIDLLPKTTEVTLTVPGGTNLKGCEVVIDPDKKLTEITRINNNVVIQ